MKLFSRKGIVAAAASAALFSGVFAAPAMAEEPVNNNSSVQILAAADSDAPGSALINFSSNLIGSGDEEEGTSEGSSAEEFGSWLSVFTGIIGALSALFGFIALF